MPRLIHQRDLPIPTQARHVVFAGENELAFTAPSADVWKVAAGPMPARPELLFPARLVLAPVAQALGTAAVEPAGGGYPRLAACPSANAVVVNTHDLVLVGCRLTGGDRPRLLSLGSGEYYPRLAFSSCGSRFAAKADTLAVFDTRSWDGGKLDSIETCGWHPQRPMHLCLGYDGELFWADWSRGVTPQIHQLGTIGVRHGWNQSRGLVVLERGERFVVAFHPPRLELWRLSPLELLGVQEPADGEVSDCRLSPNGRWLVVLFESGVRLCDTKAPFGLSDLCPEVSELEFAPTGQRFVTHRVSGETNPYPEDSTIGRAADEDAVSVWEISE